MYSVPEPGEDQYYDVDSKVGGFERNQFIRDNIITEYIYMKLWQGPH